MNTNIEIIEVVVRFDRIETLSGTYGQKGKEKRAWTHQVDYTGITGEKVKELFLGKLKVAHNQWAAKDEKRLDMPEITCLEMFDLSEAKAAKAQSFGELKGKVDTLRKYVKMADKDIKATLMSDNGLTSEHADMLLKGENPFKVEKKGSNPVKVKRSENKPSDTLTLTQDQMTALREWTIAERGNSSDPLDDDQIGNILDRCEIPEKLFGLAEFYVKSVK